MSWLRRHGVWAWPLLLAAGLAFVAAVRLWPGWASRPVSSLASEGGGVVAGDRADLAASARRLRTLQDETGRTREQLAAVQAEAVAIQEQVAILDEMLLTDRLTFCPDFLRDQTTVRALQKIMREAADTAPPQAADQNNLSTAAAVARERLRAKLEALRDQLADRTTALDQQAADLRQRLLLETTELQQLQRKVDLELQSRAASRAAPAA